MISREIGSGVVPIDAGERAWRERHGRLLRQLAEQADRIPDILRTDGGAEMKLTLLRHAQTEAACGTCTTGRRISPPCRVSVGAAPPGRGLSHGQRYYTSGMLRTEQTLEAIYGPVAHQQLPGLREMNFGDFEMKSYQELKDTAAYRGVDHRRGAQPLPPWESAPQVLRRSLAAIAPVVQRPEDAVCVVHGGVTAGLMMTWFGGGRYDYLRLPGQGFQVTFREGQPVSYTRIPAAE